MTDYEVIGGEEALRRIMVDFVGRVFKDVMIGFHFRNADQTRVTEMEYQLAAKMLGADIRYTGKPIRDAHSLHPIMAGQFMRSQMILRETLDRYEMPGEILGRWLAHS